MARVSTNWDLSSLALKRQRACSVKCHVAGQTGMDTTMNIHVGRHRLSVLGHVRTNITPYILDIGNLTHSFSYDITAIHGSVETLRSGSLVAIHTHFLEGNNRLRGRCRLARTNNEVLRIGNDLRWKVSRVSRVFDLPRSNQLGSGREAI